jgi:hypothetical protein
MDSFHTSIPPKYKKEDDKSDVALIMFDSEDDKSSDPNDCFYHIKNVSTNIQIFSIFIISIIITNSTI